MPVYKRQRNGQAFFQCGDKGKEYFVHEHGEDEARKKAIAQCVAIGEKEIQVIEKQNKGLMIGFWLNQEIATLLCLERGEPPESLHLTLTFHGNSDEMERSQIENILQSVESFAGEQPPIKGIVSGFGRFNASESSDSRDVVYASFDAPDLPEFRQELVKRLQEIGAAPFKNHGFTPHITLAYIDQSESTPMQRINNHEMEFSEVVVTVGGTHYPFTLKGKKQMPILIAKAVQRFLDLPISEDRSREWDGRAAEKRVREWATESGEINFDKYSRAFLWRDSEKPDNLTSYKLPYADVIDGRLTVIPRGLFAGAAALQGARGGVDIPSEDMERVRAIIRRYYNKAASKYDDDTIVPPWEVRKDEMNIKKEYNTSFIHKDDDQHLVYGIVLEPNTVDAQDDTVSMQEIEEAAHNYMLKSQTIGNSHRTEAKAKIVQSYIAPTDFEIGGQVVKKGSWVMVTKVFDDSLWQSIKKGDFTGYSIGGMGNRTQIT